MDFLSRLSNHASRSGTATPTMDRSKIANILEQITQQQNKIQKMKADVRESMAAQTASRERAQSVAQSAPNLSIHHSGTNQDVSNWNRKVSSLEKKLKAKEERINTLESALRQNMGQNQVYYTMMRVVKQEVARKNKLIRSLETQLERSREHNELKQIQVNELRAENAVKAVQDVMSVGEVKQTQIVTRTRNQNGNRTGNRTENRIGTRIGNRIESQSGRRTPCKMEGEIQNEVKVKETKKPKEMDHYKKLKVSVGSPRIEVQTVKPFVKVVKPPMNQKQKNVGTLQPKWYEPMEKVKVRKQVRKQPAASFPISPPFRTVPVIPEKAEQKTGSISEETDGVEEVNYLGKMSAEGELRTFESKMLVDPLDEFAMITTLYAQRIHPEQSSSTGEVTPQTEKSEETEDQQKSETEMVADNLDTFARLIEQMKTLS